MPASSPDPQATAVARESKPTRSRPGRKGVHGTPTNRSSRSRRRTRLARRRLGTAEAAGRAPRQRTRNQPRPGRQDTPGPLRTPRRSPERAEGRGLADNQERKTRSSGTDLASVRLLSGNAESFAVVDPRKREVKRQDLFRAVEKVSDQHAGGQEGAHPSVERALEPALVRVLPGLVGDRERDVLVRRAGGEDERGQVGVVPVLDDAVRRRPGLVDQVGVEDRELCVVGQSLKRAR